MGRRFHGLYFACFVVLFFFSFPLPVHATVVFLTTTGANSWSIPSDWSTTNTIEVIGGGGNGYSPLLNNTVGGGGGGGGAYSKSTNISLTPGGTAFTSIGSVAGDTWFNTTNGAPASASTGALAKGGASATSGTGAAGGAAASGIGGTTRSGGSGGNNGGGGASGGGGGAGGPSADGNNGTGGGGAGGQGDGTAGGAGGTAGGLGDGGAGGAGTEFDATHGAGGGGGGVGGATFNGGAGGLYGGGGGGGGGDDLATAPGAGGAGQQGLIVITYTPAIVPSLTTSAASSITTTTATLNGNISSTGGQSVTQHGFAYSTNSTLSTGVSTSTLGAHGTGNISEGISSLTPNTPYYFRAYATNGMGTSYGSILSFTTSFGVPSAPGTPTFASVAATSLTVNWSAGSGATTYQVNRCSGSSSCSPTTLATGIGVTTYNDTNLTTQTIYTYSVTSVNADGTATSSTNFTITTLSTTGRVIRLSGGLRLRGSRIR